MSRAGAATTAGPARLELTGVRHGVAADVRFSTRALLSSRLVVWPAAWLALAVFGANRALAAGMDDPRLTHPFGAAANFLLAPAVRYDAVWYLGIAHAGYQNRPDTAYFPLLPLLLRLGGAVVGSPLVAGLLISLLGAGIGLTLLFRLTTLELGEPAARVTVALLAFFPSALFLSALYTESLFLALSVGAVYAARQRRWAAAGVLGALCALTRSSGVLLVVPLVMVYLRVGEGRPEDLGILCVVRRGRPRLRVRLRRDALWIALVPLGLLAYLVYLQLAHGWGLAPFRVENHWGREFAGPFGAVWHAVLAVPEAIRRVLSGAQQPLVIGTPFGWQAYQLIDVPFLVFALGGLWLGVRRLSPALWGYALVACAEALSYPTQVEPMESLSRYLLVVFPLFMAWGAWLSGRPRVRRGALALSAVALAGLSALWGIWGWVA